MEEVEKIRKYIKECIEKVFDEERIPNTETRARVQQRKNFIGSHVFGEDLGELKRMYAAYSYGEQHPLYVWVNKEEFKELRPHESGDIISTQDSNSGEKTKGIWFYNERPYYVRDKNGKVKQNKWTVKHLKNLKPNIRIQARDTIYLRKLIADFKDKYDLKSNSHANLEPGEK